MLKCILMLAINIKNLTKISHIFWKKHYFFILFKVGMVMNMKKTFKEESIKILKILGFTTNIGEYNRTYFHV